MQILPNCLVDSLIRIADTLQSVRKFKRSWFTRAAALVSSPARMNATIEKSACRYNDGFSAYPSGVLKLNSNRAFVLDDEVGNYTLAKTQIWSCLKRATHL